MDIKHQKDYYRLVIKTNDIMIHPPQYGDTQQTLRSFKLLFMASDIVYISIEMLLLPERQFSLSISNIFLHLQELLEWSHQQYDAAFTIYQDNIASQSFQTNLCSELPIDAVYTWVNGSDPYLIAQLEKYKLLEKNSKEKGGRNDTTACTYENCLQIPLVIVSPDLKSDDLSSLMAGFSYQSYMKLPSFKNASIFR